MKLVFYSLNFLLLLAMLSCGKKVQNIEATVFCGSLSNPKPINPYKNANGEYIIFVSMYGCGNGDGSSWFDATSVDFLRNIVTATSNLPAGVKINKIFLKTGNYKTTESRDKVNAVFSTPNASVIADSSRGVEFVGGFLGNSIDVTSSDPTKYPTYFCGRPESKSILDDCSDGESLTSLVFTDTTTSFRNITFKGARTSTFGGAIYGKNLYLYNTRFENNFAGIHGGAIYSRGSLIKVYNSNFQDNTSAYGGAIALVTTPYLPNIWISNSSFLRNQALSSDGKGGAVYTTGNTMLFNSTFEDNFAKKLADAVFCNSCLAINSTFFGHSGNPSSTIYYSAALNGFFNTILYDNSNAVFVAAPRSFYNSVVRGGSGPADATHNVYNVNPNVLNLVQVFDATRSLYYRPIPFDTIARNTGLRVWVKNVDNPFSTYFYFKNSLGNYYKICATANCYNNPIAVNESELLALPDYIEPAKQDIIGQDRKENMPDIGTYEFDATPGS